MPQRLKNVFKICLPSDVVTSQQSYL